MKQKMTGAQALVECIRREEVDHVFCVPGESFLSVLDAIYETESIKLISNRHEGGASFMAEGYAKATGKPGVCMATRGVGGANLAIGIHTAMQDSTPMVVFLGQVHSHFRTREGFQEVNQENFFAPISKWTIEITDTDRIPELVQRAFRIAKTGRPGPVVVGLPVDVIDAVAEFEIGPATTIPKPAPSKPEVTAALAMISKAKRPIVIAGGGVVRGGAHEPLIQFSEAMALPVLVSFRRHDAFPNQHAQYLGHIGLGTHKSILDTVKSADLVIAVGMRFSEIVTQGYTLFSSDQDIIHIDIDPNSIGKVYNPAIGIVADAGEALQALVEASTEYPAENREERLAWIAERRRLYDEWIAAELHGDAKMNMKKVIADLQRITPDDAIITNDAGNFCGWLHQFYQFEKPGTYIGPTNGAMGYGLPAAVGAKLAHPERTVVSLSGDGGFMMTLQEFETAVRYEAPVIAIVFNNNMYGTIRMHQEREYPKRITGTLLTNPNFAELARLFGGYGEQIDRHEDFAPAFERALESGKPSIIEVSIDPEQISVSATIEDLRKAKVELFKA
ncbi:MULTISPECIES: thiamine pyrophosphate-dependent enzyme [unclassified Paenibacillus]|uniref:thiamine pyrophosphate-dependent enzyme n=1 Tax=unclassified Paenibacillus TaxID=185978 RepID=UPI001AE30EA4|nr:MULTISPECIES: thiamine pyrophosphate-dependent enzyme [unclassified Paenibacillus]MBP1154962.1 acetolactate synthase-1/2/3 large subunit [Paenibacillus sp. PvP091]MBP1169654.1 acetolactate synthase-1/2/3 large subunit [Paenibacillus sp. PvR098]MBP2440682.1 acetolactate synthase-1/2/3 large subunit [Paenibacillus sp. PvP052]